MMMRSELDLVSFRSEKAEVSKHASIRNRHS